MSTGTLIERTNTAAAPAKPAEAATADAPVTRPTKGARSPPPWIPGDFLPSCFGSRVVAYRNRASIGRGKAQRRPG